MKNFECTQGKGFRITFSNGLTASVQWGNGNFCDNRFEHDHCDSANYAEVAVLSCNGTEFQNANMFVPEGCVDFGDVCGYLTPEQVVEFLMNVKNFEF